MIAPPRRQTNIRVGQMVIVEKTGEVLRVQSIDFNDRRSAYIITTTGGRAFEEYEVRRTQ